MMSVAEYTIVFTLVIVAMLGDRHSPTDWACKLICSKNVTSRFDKLEKHSTINILINLGKNKKKRIK